MTGIFHPHVFFVKEEQLLFGDPSWKHHDGKGNFLSIQWFIFLLAFTLKTPHAGILTVISQSFCNFFLFCFEVDSRIDVANTEHSDFGDEQRMSAIPAADSYMDAPIDRWAHIYSAGADTRDSWWNNKRLKYEHQPM